MVRLDKKLHIENTIHVFRAKRRITQKQLAEAVGVTRATILALEKGNYNPSLELAFRLARFFDTDIESIFEVRKENNAED